MTEPSANKREDAGENGGNAGEDVRSLFCYPQLSAPVETGLLAGWRKQRLEARPATRSDLAKVFPKLADRMAREYRTAGHSVFSAKDMLRGQIDEGDADCLMDNGQPLAVLTWFVEGSNAYTSFAAVEEFFAPRYVRPLRTHMRKRQAALGGITMVSLSFSDHPSTARWFNALGFQGPVAQPDCPTVFRLFRP